MLKVLQVDKYELFNPLVPKAHNNECQVYNISFINCH